MSALLALLLVANGTAPAAGDTRYDAIGRLNWYCTAVLVSPAVILTARHCVLEGQNEVTFGSAKVTVSGFYFPQVGDAALGYLSHAPDGVEPIPMALSTPQPAQPVTFVGTGIEGIAETCETSVIWSDPTTILMPGRESHPPGCWLESGDSGGPVIVGGRARRVFGIGASVNNEFSVATSLEQFASDPVFNPTERTQ